MVSLSHDRPTIIEVGPRDGLQSEQKVLEPKVRAALITRLATAGLHRIEAVSFVSPKAVPTMSGANEVLQLVGSIPADCSLSGLALNQRGAHDALVAGCSEVNFVVVASDTFSQRNQGKRVMQVAEQIIEMLPVVHGAGVRATVTIGAAFGCPFEGEVPLARVLELSVLMAEAGCREISLADTIGVATPKGVKMRFSALAQACPDASMRAHFHDTRSTGMANVMAALESDVMAFDASVAGYGGCPFAPAATGNIATEDLVYLLDREGFPTDVDLDCLIETARWLSGKLQVPMPGGVANAGGFPSARSNTFEAHE